MYIEMYSIKWTRLTTTKINLFRPSLGNIKSSYLISKQPILYPLNMSYIEKKFLNININEKIN